MNELLLNALMTVLTVGLSLVSAYVILFIRKVKAKVESEILKIEDEKQQNLLREALWEIDELPENQ